MKLIFKRYRLLLPIILIITIFSSDINKFASCKLVNFHNFVLIIATIVAARYPSSFFRLLLSIIHADHVRRESCNRERFTYYLLTFSYELLLPQERGQFGMRQADSAFQSVGADTKPVETGSPSTSSWCCTTTCSALRTAILWDRSIRRIDTQRAIQGVPHPCCTILYIHTSYTPC